MKLHPAPHCRVLPPGEFKCMSPRAILPVYCESFVIIAVTVFLLLIKQSYEQKYTVRGTANIPAPKLLEVSLNRTILRQVSTNTDPSPMTFFVTLTLTKLLKRLLCQKLEYISFYSVEFIDFSTSFLLNNLRFCLGHFRDKLNVVKNPENTYWTQAPNFLATPLLFTNWLAMN